jgi:hypothetical protein
MDGNKFKRPWMKNEDCDYVMSFSVHQNQGFHELMSKIIEEHKNRLMINLDTESMKIFNEIYFGLDFADAIKTCICEKIDEYVKDCL